MEFVLSRGLAVAYFIAAEERRCPSGARTRVAVSAVDEHLI